MALKFREKALAKLRSPEQLDEPLKIIPRQTQLGLRSLWAVAIVALLWGIFGGLPETGRGQGILITPNSVVPVQAQADGQVANWFVKVGDVVEKGAVLGTLTQSALDQELMQLRERLLELQARNQALVKLRDRYTGLERTLIINRRKVLQKRAKYSLDYIEQAKTMSEQVNLKKKEHLKKQRRNILAAKKAALELRNGLKERLESYVRLRAEKLAPEDSVTKARRAYEEGKLKIRDLDLEVKQLDAKEVQIDQDYLDARNRITAKEHELTELRLQVRELDNREAQLNKQDRETQFRDKNEINELKRKIGIDEKRLRLDREIKSDYGGRVLELTVAEGGVVSRGQRLAQLDARDASSKLVALAYFTDKIGKQLGKGMRVHISPTTVSQKTYGSIIGHVVSVSDFPVTAEAVMNNVGNSEVAQQLTSGGHQIEVFAELEVAKTTPTGFAWTSVKGPDIRISAGTSAGVWVTYERRFPLSYIPPKLREWTGL